MKLLSIETSCDETAIAIMDFEKEQKGEIKFNVLSNHVLSQINIHREFGGVFPMLAKREHAKNIVKIFTECIKESGIYQEKKESKDEFNLEKIEEVKILLEREPEMFTELINLVRMIEKPQIDAIAVTKGPGLAPALWVGINFAKAISIIWDIKVYPINHMEGHIVSTLISPVDAENKSSYGEFFIKKISSPAISLLISGGHTEIISFNELYDYKKIGQTVDDAIGEAYDKVARSLNLPYPGGPEISKIADLARVDQFKLDPAQKLPRPMISSHDLNFSFSGLKTAVIYKIKKLKEENINEEEIKKIISLDFENACADILIKKVRSAIEKTNAKSLIIGGGVIANRYLRKSFLEFAEKENLNLFMPEKFLTGDNAFMIGVAAIVQILNNKKDIRVSEIKADSNFSIENI
jgi:N6-L-threonylcarbamoyladenine synthase